MGRPQADCGDAQNVNQRARIESVSLPGTTVVAISSNNVVVAFRQHADAIEVQLEPGRTYDVTFR